MSSTDLPLIDWEEYATARDELGPAFIRMFGYFREDGLAAVECLEEAVRAKDASAMVVPADKLATDAAQFGALRLAQLADKIEEHARLCVEARQTPDDYVEHVVALRPLFQETLAAIAAEASPLVQRQGAA